jgi:acetylornithine deacetylase/succinyl-diaminopimelate desuccinylase-like protein
MDHRRDAGLAAAQTALEVERVAIRHGGLGTTGQLAVAPGVVTAVPGAAALAVDLRHERGDGLQQLLDDTLACAHAAAAARGCGLTVEPIWRIAPRAFDPALVAAARAASAAVGGRERPLASGALHDAAELAPRVPATMIFSSSRGGVSHAPDEDTDERDLALAIEVFGRVTSELVTGALVPARDAEASAAC